MDLGTTLLLGLIAGSTIVLGMPVGRLRAAAPRVLVMLNAITIGVLLFLLWDVLSAAWEPTDAALSATHENTGGFGPVLGYGLLFVVGISVGLMSLVAYEQWMRRKVARVREAALASPVLASASVLGPPEESGLSLASASNEAGVSGLASWSPARQLALLIAVGIGAHNFAEGLAIGQSAASDDIALATVLVIGFALHNATEGFGIVAPLAGDIDEDGRRRIPSWPFLLSLAAIGGGPTFVGTWVGHGFTSEALSVVFLSLAAGSITYVILQLVAVVSKARRPDLLGIGLLIGLFAGFLTDGILVAAGV
jgi:zinc transporter, ZIP family